MKTKWPSQEASQASQQDSAFMAQDSSSAKCATISAIGILNAPGRRERLTVAGHATVAGRACILLSMGIQEYDGCSPAASCQRRS